MSRCNPVHFAVCLFACVMLSCSYDNKMTKFFTCPFTFLFTFIFVIFNNFFYRFALMPGQLREIDEVFHE